MKTLFTLLLFLIGFLHINAQVSVKTYGAKGDGVTDDAAAIQDALNSGNSTVSFEAGKTYITSAFLSVPSGVKVVGNNATLKPSSAFTKYAFPVIGTSGKSEYTQSGLAITVTKGSSTFNYSKASSLSIGSIIWLEGPQYIFYGTESYSYGWYGTISAISGSVVTLNTPSTNSYTAISVTQYETTKNVQITGINVNLKGRTTGYGIGLGHSVNSSVTSCFVESDPTTTSAEVGISAVGVNLEISKNKVRNIRIPRSGSGYGINAMGHFITVRENDVAVARHCITSSGRFYMSTNINFIKNTVDCGPGSAPLDFHGNANGKMDSNTVTSTTPNIAGIMVRNSNTTVSNNTITMTNASGTRIYGIAFSENGYNGIMVIKNKIYFKGTLGNVTGVSNFSVSGTINDLYIKDNYMQGGVGLTASLGNNIRIDSNTFEGNNIYNPYISLNTLVVKEYYIEGNTFINNFDNRSNYSISTTQCATSSGYIRNNTVRCNKTSNMCTQFRINNKHNIVENNIFYTQDDYPLVDYSTEKENWLSGNKRIDAADVTTLITYKTMPPATAWFLGRTISYTDSYGVTSQYLCIKTGTSTYAWQKQTTSFVTKVKTPSLPGSAVGFYMSPAVAFI